MTWRKDAACFGQNPEQWFPEHSKSDTLFARMVCQGCPVQAECDTEAKRIAATDGIWAGRDRGKRKRKA